MQATALWPSLSTRTYWTKRLAKTRALKVQMPPKNDCKFRKTMCSRRWVGIARLLKCRIIMHGKNISSQHIICILAILQSYPPEIFPKKAARTKNSAVSLLQSFKRSATVTELFWRSHVLLLHSPFVTQETKAT